MFSNLFKKSYPKKSKTSPITLLKEKIISLEENRWILEDRFILAAFKDLFDRFSEELAQKMLQERPIAFLRASGKYACALSANDKFHIIILFPEVIKVLKGARNDEGLAILAHELGHIYHAHSKRNIDSLEAQVQADTFACELGLGHALSDFLQDVPETIETRVRLSRITASVLSNKGH